MTKLLTINYRLSVALGIIFIMLSVASCEPDRGDKLDGKWQLKEVTLADGTVNAVDTVWYNFQNTLFMYQLYEKESDTYPYIYALKTWEDKDHIMLEMQSAFVTVESFLPYTDWETGTRTFRVDECSGSKLVLSSDGKKYRFRKF